MYYSPRLEGLIGEWGVAAEARRSIRAGMGNASAKEGENGHMAAAYNGGGSSSSAGGAAALPPPPLSPPDAVMLERPPPVPYLFAPQVMIFIYHPKLQEGVLKNARKRNDRDINLGCC